MTRSELDATVVERVVRRYPQTLSGEEATVLARAAHALRNHDALVEALTDLEWSGTDPRRPRSEGYCPNCDSLRAGVHDEKCELGRTLTNARKAP